MNIILLEQTEIFNNLAVIYDRKKFLHITEVLKVSDNEILRIGLINGKIGKGRILEIDYLRQNVTLEVSFEKEPPSPLKIVLIIALPRPKTLKKVLHAAVSIGIKKIFIIKTWRVEKSYWSSPVLSDESLRRISIEALEQAKDTVLPEIYIRKRFKPFIEDELSFMVKGKKGIVAHPTACKSFFDNNFEKKADFLAIGPEGGFIDYEVEKFKEIGFDVLKLNERILRVEFALPVILSRFL